MIVAWDPVTLDCAGGPELAVTYHVLESAIRQVGQGVNADGSPAPIYATDPWVDVVDTTAAGAVVLLPDPAVGDCALVDVEATDAAGNSSLSCAGP